jgi:16S rRNA processing protein RimM
VGYNANILLGRISKIQGYDGTLTVKLEKDFIEHIPEMESVFLEIEGKPVPFFISSSEYSEGDIFKLRFEWYGTYEKVSDFAGCLVFLTFSDGKNTPRGISESITGFKVILKDKSIVGNIEEIIHNPGQDLLKIISPEKKEILIPFHEDFILRIDEKKRTITVDIPEGLTEIN